MPAPSDFPPPPPPGIDILPAMSLEPGDLSAIDPDSPTHPALRVTPDKSEIIRLDRDAATIVVGNPNHINVLADTARTLILVPKAPGATYFAVLDDKSEIVMQRHVIVAAPTEKYIRIRKACATGVENCQATQVYYCPDMCHEILMNDKQEVKAGETPLATPKVSGEDQAATQTGPAAPETEAGQ